MRNKRVLTLLLGLAFMLTVVACGNKETGKKGDDKKAQETVQGETENDAEEEEDIKEDTEKEGETPEDATQTDSNNTQTVESAVEKVTMYAKSSVNVRSGAGTSNNTIGSLTKGQEVVKIGEENGWSKIEFNGGVGYVSSKYLSTEKVNTSTANSSTGNSNSNNSTTPSASNAVETPTETKPSVTECEHWYQPEFKEYDVIKQYIYGCNGCGYPLFTFSGNNVVNLPDLYSHPACYSDKLSGDCVGGGFHSESYTRGFCGICHDEVKYRQCMFTEMGKRCVKNEALGAYEHVEFDANHFAYFKSCRCGRNDIFIGSNGKGLMFTKETCTYCGEVKTYPQY